MNKSISRDDRRAREVLFYDNWAWRVDHDNTGVERAFEGSTSPENRFILRHLGPLQGKRLLDLGCGNGESSVYFALQGASCVASDISAAMLERAAALAVKRGVAIETKLTDAMNIDYPDDSFDIVYAANVLHHADPYIALRQMRRVAKPGGAVCFWDPIKHNPIINIYRRMAKDMRTPDEAPLDINIIRFVKAMFSEVYYDTFWLASLWIFLRFYLIERVDPDKEAYWKKIISDEPRLRQLYCRLERFDNLLKCLPYIKRFAWNLAVVAKK